jgi:hypothetical protein
MQRALLLDLFASETPLEADSYSEYLDLFMAD